MMTAQRQAPIKQTKKQTNQKTGNNVVRDKALSLSTKATISHPSPAKPGTFLTV